MVQTTLMQYGVRVIYYCNGKAWVQQTLTDFWPDLFETAQSP